MYRSVVSYSYRVGGRPLVGNRVRFGDDALLSWPGPAARLVERYRFGSAVPVFYNPDSPEESLLEPGLTRAHFFWSAIALLVLGAGCALLLAFLLAAE